MTDISGMQFVLFLILPLTAFSWDILFVNVFAGGSHQTVGAYTANVLADHGHSVTYVSTNLPKYLRSQIKKVTLTENERVGNHFLNSVVDDPDFSLGKALSNIKIMLGLCGPFFEDPFVQHLMTTNAKFDAMISLGALYDSCSFALAHKLKIPGRIVQFPAPSTFPAQIASYGLPIYHSSVNHDGVTYQDNGDVKASAVGNSCTWLTASVSYKHPGSSRIAVAASHGSGPSSVNSFQGYNKVGARYMTYTAQSIRDMARKACARTSKVRWAGDRKSQKDCDNLFGMIFRAQPSTDAP